MSEEVKEKPGYLIVFNKQTSMLGEVVSITTNLPTGATQDEIGAELVKLGNALDDRMRALNKLVLEKTGKNLEELGIEPGTAKVFEKTED